MKLLAEIDGDKHEITLTHGDGKMIAEVDGRKYELEVSEPEPESFLIKDQGNIYSASVSPIAGEMGASRVRIGRAELDIRISDPKRLRGAGGADSHGDGPAEIKTAMPGKVVRVLVAVGDELEKGQGVLVVEAMKMQNELKSPKAGVVKEIRASEGQAVSAGDVLATVE